MNIKNRSAFAVLILMVQHLSALAQNSPVPVVASCLPPTKTSSQFCKDTKERIHCENKKSLLNAQTFSSPRLEPPKSSGQEPKLATVVSEAPTTSASHLFSCADQRRAHLSEFCNKEGAKIGITVEGRSRGSASINPGSAKNSLTPLQLTKESTTPNRQTSLLTPLPGQ